MIASPPVRSWPRNEKERDTLAVQEEPIKFEVCPRQWGLVAEYVIWPRSVDDKHPGTLSVKVVE